MASLFGALGSLAESYGLARQNLEQSNLRRVQQQTEQTRLQMEQARLEFEKAQAEREKQYKPLVDIGLPPFKDPATGKLTYQRWSPYEGKIVKFEDPGGGDILEATRQYIRQQDPADQQHLTEYAQALTPLYPDPRDVSSKVMALGETLAGKRETQLAQEQKEQRGATEYDRRRREIEAEQEKLQQQRFTEQEKLSGNLLRTRQQMVSTDSAIKNITTILQNGGVLNSLLSAGKIDLAIDPQGAWSSVISREADLTDQESIVATAFIRLTEAINVLRGPLQATGFRGPEAFAALQAQRGQPLANPRITLGVLAGTREYLQQLNEVNKVQLQGTIQQIQDVRQQQPPIVLDLGPPVE